MKDYPIRIALNIKGQPIKLKRCGQCLEEKTLEHFRQHTGYDKIKTVFWLCKVCDETKSRFISEKINLKKENENKLINYLKDKECADCGESDIVVLEFDHVKDKEYGISQMMSKFNWRRIEEEIEKCEIVCANCHKKRTASQFGWYKWDKMEVTN